MAMTTRVDIVSIDRTLYSGSATFVSVPTQMGEVGLTPLHTQLLANLRPGEVRVTSETGEITRFYVGFGILEVQPFVVTIVADWAMAEGDAEGIDIEKLQKELEAEDSYVASREQLGVLDFESAQSVLIEGAERLKWIQSLRSGRVGSRH
ncbi:MAG: ATP synthase F1 subunit epsilon [Halothiobacillaceae bacterium]|nr:ATP synthase F1 subunit epsilon [Halothiobacillaceae bacterium]